ncbi:MAG: gliding motility-associated C-terminal domain-containing protein, partial [Chitinophagales bacterium]|nr:gliding motility-associated C-terminal domain-containing protein [Chitinophagales bacterium]
PGDPVNLIIVTNPQSCGVAQTPCNGNSVQAIIGTGTGTIPATPTQYPTIYGHYSNSARHQFLYLQSELIALIGSGGTIDSISFYMVPVNAVRDTMKNFEIKFGCTQAADLTSWQSNLSTVFSAKNVPLGTTAGWITHKLDFPYDWDGTSNLVVDVCFNNPPVSPSALNKRMQYTPTTFQSVYYTRGSSSQCGNTGTPQTSVNRPNARFSVCVTDVVGLPISWTPATGANAPNPTNIVNPVANPQTPQVYGVDVTSANGCHTNDFVFVNVDTSVRLYAYPADTFFCSPVPIQLTTQTFGSPLPGNTFTYTWTNLTTNTAAGTGPSITVTPAGNTDYLVTLTGAACTLHDTVHVLSSTSIPVTLIIDSISCFGANDAVLHAIPAGGSQPINYLWSNNATSPDSIVNLAPGNYSVTITDAQTCTGTASTTITQPTQLSYTANFTNILCNGDNNGTITISPTGGTPAYTYLWAPAQPNDSALTGLAAGNYAVTVSDQNNCTVSAASTISEPPALIVTVTTTNTSCDVSNDGTAIFNSTGGTPAYTYNWAGPANTTPNLNSLDDGNYQVTATDAGNCTATAAFVIDTTYVLHVSIPTTTNASCFGVADGAATVATANGTGPFTYLWAPGNQQVANATGLSAATYTVVVTDAKNCVASDSATITEPAEIVLAFSHTNPLCSGIANGQVSVTATGGNGTFTYDWDYLPGAPDNNTISGIEAGIYNVTVTDGNNCSIAGADTLLNPPSLNAALINKNEITCANALDGSVEVSVSGGTPPIAFIWTNSSVSPIISNLAPGTYSVTVSDVNGCDTSLTVAFTAPPLISVDELIIDSVSCPAYTDGAIQISGTGGTPGSPAPYEYSIDGTNFFASEKFINLPAGAYKLIIRDSEGCTLDTTVQVFEPIKPALTILPQDSTIDPGETITLFSSLSDYTTADIHLYSWSPFNGLNCTDCPTVLATPYTTTSYTLTVNYLEGCSVSQTVTVYVGNGDDFYAPNAFTPNGDGNNDVFAIYGAGLAKASLQIFNRWGEKIFDSSNQWLGWDGTYKGTQQNPGVYTYQVQAVYLNGKTKEKKGTVTLIR